MTWLPSIEDVSPFILGRCVFASLGALGGVVGNPIELEKRNGIAYRDSRPGWLCELCLASGDGNGTVTDPAAFDEANDRAGVRCQDWRAALPKHDRMAQQKDFRGKRKLLELGFLDGKHHAGGPVLHR